MTTTPTRLAEIRKLIEPSDDRSIPDADAVLKAARELLHQVDNARCVCVRPNTEVVDEGHLPGHRS